MMRCLFLFSDSDDDENSKPKKEEDEAEKDLKDIHSISGVVNRLSNLGILKQMAEESKIAQEEERKRKEAELKEKEIHDAQERRRRLFIEKQEKERKHQREKSKMGKRKEAWGKTGRSNILLAFYYFYKSIIFIEFD